MACSQCSVTYSKGMDSGEAGGVDSGMVAMGAGTVKRSHARIRSLSSASEMRWSGLRVKMLPRMSFNSSVKGRMVFRNSGDRVYARYVESSIEACFHGLRPQVRFTRITPRLHTSFGAQK